MIERVISWCALHRLVTLLLVTAAAGVGLWSVQHTALDAEPDLSDVQVLVFTEWAGHAPDLVEDQVTYPIVTTLVGTPHVTAVRGQSMFGMSFVTVLFEDGTDLYWARSRVLEFMQRAVAKLPAGVTPTLGPDATGVGWVFEYALRDRSGHTDLAALQSLQNWTLRFALQSVSGVAEVASIGGFVKQYQVDVDPNRLAAFHVPLKDVVDAIRRSNGDVGARVVELSGTENFIRGRGYVTSPKDLEQVVLRSEQGTPVTVADVGKVTLGPAERRGLAELDGEGQTVGGLIIMRSGENALEVISAVKERLAQLGPSLPAGVEVIPTYDRSALIQGSIRTLEHTLAEELLVVGVVILLFLLHFQSTLIPMVMLPVAILLAFIPMKQLGLTANIMSLGGIAIAIGAMVDAAIIVVENIHKHLEQWEVAGRPGRREEIVVRALLEVGRPIFFSLLVITVAFLPVFALEGTAGRLFRPLAFTKTFAMAAAALLSITLVPALAAVFIRGKIQPESTNPVSRVLDRLYAPVCRLALRFRFWVIAAALLLIAATVPVVSRLGGEFMPPFNEGTLLYMPTAVPGMSDTTAGDVLQRQDQVLRRFPEVDHVFGKAAASRRRPTRPLWRCSRPSSRSDPRRPGPLARAGTGSSRSSMAP